ncbi:hypothetical protein Asulf_01102 [Archaeoglobus sulfaticallidus PM70-1]|uniref:Uncharacterized protein n=1 Tax=Archaeoglobus sulfaticallidus PM70-1 TaxID=387631 RepID=N0BFQ4_9EURY|nr:hypothetical protein Asulf_01102 [Archaeoglobus sulfaticallidus PM70-1]
MKRLLLMFSLLILVLVVNAENVTDTEMLNLTLNQTALNGTLNQTQVNPTVNATPQHQL